ncbi:MAG: RelA/SpoT family protein [Actinomycetota bacterium]
MEGREQARVERRGGLLARRRQPAPRRPSIDALLRTLKSRNPRGDLARVERAYDLADAAHVGQHRLSGEDYIEHPIEVARIVSELGLDTTAVVAALLHDVVEDTPVTLDEIREAFDEEVAALVDGLTKLDALTFRTREQEQAENVRKMIVAMAGDIRVLLIKLADRLHNMRTLGALDPERQRRIANETLAIYAPLTDRLGVQQWKWELEDLAFKALHPGPYREIASLVERRREERQEYVDGLLGAVRQRLREAGLRAEVEGRPKHLYSIYEKMVLGGKEFNEIYDLAGIRVLVDSTRDAYAALGAVHALWKPVPGRFKDYVAMPKENMYQSLHTTVIGPGGRNLEVQIRTREMHRTAEYGIAAHWRYKEGRDGRRTKDAADLVWLRQMLDWLQDAADPSEVMEGLRIDLYGGQVFVFTPQGDVTSLPAGATPVDFAYAIHTEVGHRTMGAKVNGRLVPLDYQLRTGDTVEVLTARSDGEGPSQDWLGFVVSPRARTKIRQWFSRERREDALEEGRDAMQRLLRKQHVPVKRAATEAALRELAAEMGYVDVEGLYVAIGEGQVSPQSVLARITQSAAGVGEEEVAAVPLSRPVHLDRLAPTSGIVVQGDEDVWVRLARCCTPVPGDDILGFVTRGSGVSVHRTDCPNAGSLTAQPERLIAVRWRPGRSTSFVVAIQVEALDRTHLLSDVASALSEQHVNILSATSTVRKDRTTSLRFTFELADIAHLAGVLAAVRGVDNVYDAFRVVPG